MKRQPLLPDFPRHIFATAQRKLQASLSAARKLIEGRSLTGLSSFFSDIIAPDFLEEIDPTKRLRHFGQRTVFWAWLTQVLEHNASCSRSLSLIQSWCRQHNLAIPSSDTSSYCKARARLHITFLRKIYQRIIEILDSRVRDDDRWHGLRLMAIDGSTVQLLDTPQNQRLYPQASGQKQGCGHPVMGIVGLLNLAHGAWVKVKTCKWNCHDSRAAASLISALTKDDLLLADRAFCSFELLARCHEQGTHTLIRLHQARHKTLDWRKGKKLGPHERLVTWKKPYRPKGSTLSKEQWQALPKQITVRLIRLNYENRAGEKEQLVLVTSLTDHRLHEAHELADLYLKRWDIELKFRDLKTTSEMELFRVKTPRMAHRTLWMSLIAHALVRSVMQQAATTAETPIYEISFKGVLDTLNTSHESFRGLIATPRKLRKERSKVIEIAATKLINIRPFRSEPRVLKRRPKNYRLMTKPRRDYPEHTDNSSPRKSA